MFFRSLFAALLLLSIPSVEARSCREHDLTPPGAVKLEGDSVMIVVHQSSSFDARFSTKRGADEAIRFAKSKRIPVIYLQDETPDEYYFMEDCRPDYWVFSAGGEISFDVAPAHVYIVGGHLELCLSAALHDIILQWSRRAPRDFTITYFMDAIYSNGRMIDPGDPFYKDFVRFMDIVTYGRPGGEHWPKLTLLETLGIIIDPEHEFNYLGQILPRWDRTFPENYQVEVELNGVRRVLRSAPGLMPPTVRFRFFDSALSLSSPSCLTAGNLATCPSP